MDLKSPLVQRLLLLLAGTGAAAEFAHLIVPWQYRGLFESIGAAEGVDPNLLHAIAIQENWHQDPLAMGALNKNGTRDYGLMQINEVNFARLGLGTVDAGLWKDPAASITAAAQLLKANKAAAPGLGLVDQFAVYNAGLSAYGPRPKLTDAGVYINAPYAWSAWLWYVAVVAAQLAPLKIKRQLT